MTNMNKRGYSTKEVAQILGVHYTTIRHMVDTGRIECLMDPPVTPGGRRKIRFTREHIAKYLGEHREHYDEATLKAWGVTEDSETTGTAEVIDPKTEKPENDMSEFGVTSLDKLSGAWAGFVKAATEVPNKPALVITPDKTEDEEVTSTKAETYYIFVDGRLCLGNMSSETARTILCALMTDENFGYHQITIKRM
jgi:excisionase family DNA binding protein